jgi:phage FluMu gp28-like protein
VNGPLGSRQFSETLPPVIQLRPYQQRWIDDGSRFKLAVKSARIGYSYATGLEAIFDCLEKPNTSWTVLSASKAQSTEFVEQCSKNIQAMGATAEAYSETFADELGATDILVQKIRFPGTGARIMALPANPRTARGYPGNAILDEFAHHQDSYAIWAAIGRQVALGHKLRALSTPNGEQGKFFDLAREFGFADGVAPLLNPLKKGAWSCHWVDIHMAIADGCPISVDAMRDLFKDDDSFAQEFLCVFLKAAGSWLPLELIATCEDAGATIDWPAGYEPAGPLFAGIDVARDHHATILWLDEVLGDVAWTRMVLPIYAMPFFAEEGKPCQAQMLLPWVEMCTRTAMDATGLGVGLYDWLNMKVRGRVMGLSFAGTNDQGVKIKTDLATRIKGNLERRRSRIPYDPQIRAEFQAIKREPTSTGVKFDAPQIEVDTAVAGGQKKKRFAHADRFWAKAMADLAAQGSVPAVMGSVEAVSSWYQTQARGRMSRAAQEFHGREEEMPVAVGQGRRSLWAGR